MKSKAFNKIGDTTFRKKIQINAYIEVAKFLLEIINEENNDLFTSNFLNSKFINWATTNNVYKYNGFKIDRFGMIKNIFLTLGIVESYNKNNKNLFKIHKKKIIEFINSKDCKKYIYNNFYNKLKYFKEIIIMISNNDKKFDPLPLILAMEIYDGDEKIEWLYDEISKDYNSILTKWAHKNFEDKTLDLESYLQLFRKKPSIRNIEILRKLLNFKKNNKSIKDEQFKELLNIPTFKTILRSDYFKSHSKILKCNKEVKKKGYEYINNVLYNDLIIDLEKARIFNNLSCEYYDLNNRWFKELGLIKDGKIKNN